ncbi:MAG: hypothetical protein NTZ87_00950 [Candidatus Nomurabacteria bacterium]|nr:hypothetical protein [Candidatus Nomurabacteria bacterium]
MKFTLHNLIFYLFILAIAGFVIWQIWNLINGFRKGKIYNLSRKPLWGVDEQGKYHIIMLEDKTKSKASFSAAVISSIMFLVISLVVLAISLLVVIFPV